MDCPIETIGDMREFLAQFPPEADDFPFLVCVEGEDPAEEPLAAKVTNERGYPDYAMVVIP